MFTYLCRYSAEFDFYSLACCASPCLCLNSTANRCCLDNTRLYFYVLENGYEYSVPIPVFDTFCTLMVRDHIYRYYFDGGIYARNNPCWLSQCMRGKTEIFSGEIQHVFMGENCSPSLNRFANCYWPRICGERVRVVPADTICFIVPTRANMLCNFCGFCGPKDGEPLCLLELVNSLKQGSAARLSRELEEARASWLQRSRQL